MARKASSKKSEAQTPPPDLPFTPATPMPSRPATPTPSRPKTKFPKTQAPQPPQAPPPDVGETSAQGLLQLSFARHAHGYGILGAVALLLNTILLLTLGSTGSLVLPGGLRLDFILYLLPAVAGALASWDAVRLKRAPYRSHYVSGHFAISIAGMLLFFIIAMSIIIMIREAPPTWLVPLLYPVAVSGVPLTIVSMGMTWQGFSSRKIGSMATALFLPVFMSVLTLFPLFGLFPIDTSNWLNLLAVTFLTGALATEISGSLLHIIASSTSVYQREILKADNTKVALIQQDYQQKREALEYKERALRGRETHLEALQLELEDQAKDLKAKLADITGREAAVEKSTAQLRDLDKKVASTRAEMEAKAEEMRLREGDLALLQKELDKTKQAFAARETSLADREKEVKRASIEMTSKLRNSEAKLKSIEEREARLQEQEKTFDTTRTTLLKKEKELDLKESELRMKGERLEATHSAAEATRIRELKDWEQKILAKEKELGKQEVELRTLENRLKSQYENATRIDKQFQGQRRMMEDRESEFVAREKAIADQEAALRQRAAEIERQIASVEQAQSALDEKTKKYSEVFKDQKMKEAAVGSSAEDIRRQKEALASREKKIAEMQANLQSEIKRLNEENRALMERAKEIEERESEVQLRALELEGKAREGRAGAAAGMRDMDRDAQLEAWEARLREREEELKRRTYQKEKEMEMREGAIKARIMSPGAEAAAEEAVDIETKAERVKTGTPRLDDLLYGGIPFNSNVLFVGPAFVGKEVVLLNFIAEGLKKGIPVIIITTTKLPVDVAKDIAPILPTFVEYDQLGLVRWIDCTSPIASGKPTREKNVWRVNGPTDFDNIYQIVSQLDEEFKKKYPYFRLAYLTLSSSITQADEREAMTFFQRLVNRLRQTKAVSVIALERGMHNDQTLEALEHMVDGAIHFKSDKQKTMLQVNGLGEIQTHDWVPYKHTNKAIMIGSFQLERIR
ncbi:MAG TPA: ATPase domain-containing protein [Thermoplasmata archaeon]|nr:ATPase domain-containing protein [Thermoplasmata archaeon]